MSETDQVYHYRCTTCDARFVTDDDAEEHVTPQNGHAYTGIVDGERGDHGER